MKTPGWAIRDKERRDLDCSWCRRERLAKGTSALRQGDEALIMLNDQRVFVGTVRRNSPDAIVLRLPDGPSLWFGSDEVRRSCVLRPGSSEREPIAGDQSALLAIAFEAVGWDIVVK